MSKAARRVEAEYYCAPRARNHGAAAAAARIVDGRCEVGRRAGAAGHTG